MNICLNMINSVYAPKDEVAMIILVVFQQKINNDSDFRDCKEDLCESCVIAHQRVKLTREHAIFHYPDTPNSNRLPATFTTHQAQDSDVIR